MESPATPGYIVLSIVGYAVEIRENVVASNQPKGKRSVGEGARKSAATNHSRRSCRSCRSQKMSHNRFPLAVQRSTTNQQKNQQLGKAYQELKAQFDELQRGLEEKETEFEQAQQDAEEMAGLVRSAEEKIATYKMHNNEQQQQIQTLRQQLTELQNRETASAQPEDITTAKVDRNDLGEIHRRYSAVLSIITERKCSLNNAYRLAGTPRSTIRRPVGSVGRVPDYRAGGRGFKPPPDQHSGSLNN